MPTLKHPPSVWTDGTLSLLAQGYAWLPDHMRASADGTVRTRLLGRRTVALRGPEAVAFFYDEQHVRRRAALPDPVLDTLFGQGAVHTLDGLAHRVRKAMFLSGPDHPAVPDAHAPPQRLPAPPGVGGKRRRAAQAHGRGTRHRCPAIPEET